MNSEIKKKWQAALRSGKYRQGTGTLKKRARKKVYHCCLGVLCELHLKALKIKPTSNSPHAEKLRCDYLPSEDVCSWAGLPQRDPLVLHRGETRRISALNDKGVKFPTIAKLIDQL